MSFLYLKNKKIVSLIFIKLCHFICFVSSKFMNHVGFILKVEKLCHWNL